MLSMSLHQKAKEAAAKRGHQVLQTFEYPHDRHLCMVLVKLNEADAAGSSYVTWYYNADLDCFSSGEYCRTLVEGLDSLLSRTRSYRECPCKACEEAQRRGCELYSS